MSGLDRGAVIDIYFRLGPSKQGLVTDIQVNVVLSSF